jgi:hypothetical protein
MGGGLLYSILLCLRIDFRPVALNDPPSFLYGEVYTPFDHPVCPDRRRAQDGARYQRESVQHAHPLAIILAIWRNVQERVVPGEGQDAPHGDGRPLEQDVPGM